MRTPIRTLLISLLCLMGLAACAPAIRPGDSSREDVLATWGNPTLRFPEAEGGERLIYASGPLGMSAQVVILDAAGRVRSRHNALREEEFAKVLAGEDDRDSILRRFGPPGWVYTFAARGELVWEWRYCDQWTYPARFNVLFDLQTGKLRSTLTLREDYGPFRSFCSPIP